MKKLTKVQRRVAIVKDAIKQLKLELYTTGSGGYLGLPVKLLELQRKFPDGSAQEALCDLTKKNPCDVCAKGALLLSTVRLENRFNLKELINSHEAVITRLIEDNLFTKKNLFLVEAYYEGWTVYGYLCDCYDARLGSGLTLDEYGKLHEKKVKELSVKFSDKKPRLLAILKNMVRHGGLFKP